MHVEQISLSSDIRIIGRIVRDTVRKYDILHTVHPGCFHPCNVDTEPSVPGPFTTGRFPLVNLDSVRDD